MGKRPVHTWVFRLGALHAACTAQQPAIGELHDCFGVGMAAGVGRALIKGHDDVAPMALIRWQFRA